MVVDVGCAMGYFTLPLAGLVGPTGRVIAVDLQARMLRALDRRARRAGLSEPIETRRCGADSLELATLPAALTSHWSSPWRMRSPMLGG